MLVMKIYYGSCVSLTVFDYTIWSVICGDWALIEDVNTHFHTQTHTHTHIHTFPQCSTTLIREITKRNYGFGCPKSKLTCT